MRLSTALTTAVAVLCYATVSAAQIDVVFKIDESGSMGDDIQAVSDNVIVIFNALPPGSHVGLVGYGTPEHGGGSDQIPHIHRALTPDPVDFQAGVNELVAYGGLEQGYRAVYESATDTIANGTLAFTGAPYCNILITDETPNQGGRTQAEAITAMTDSEGVFFGILPAYLFTEAQLLADETGGQLFALEDFRNDPTPVIDAVLEACVEAALPVKVDIKPQSCPNPFMMGKAGVVPVAIVGSETFDVTSVNADSLMLEGVCPAIRWGFEDVVTPYEGGFGEIPNENECTTNGADGWTDMTVKFDSACLSATQGVVTERDVRLWTLTGTYTDGDGDVVAFEVQDVVRIMPGE